MSKKFYAVAKGKQTGIFDVWLQAEQQVKSFNGACFKGFASVAEAKQWFVAQTGATPLCFFDEGIASAQAIPQNATQSHHTALAQGKVVIYTDGGADPNPGPGGYGVVLLFGQTRQELSAGFARTTNNRMEIQACIAGLSELKHKSDVVIYTDSRYLADAVEKGWAARWRENDWMRTKTEAAVNADLWEQLLTLIDKHNVEFVWVKGHAGSAENERCDVLATQALRRRGLPTDIGFGA